MGAAGVSVARPLNRVRDALREVEQGDLDVHLPVDDLGELGRLAEGVNDLVGRAARARAAPRPVRAPGRPAGARRAGAAAPSGATPAASAAR